MCFTGAYIYAPVKHIRIFNRLFLIYAPVKHIRIFHRLFLIYAPVKHIRILQRLFLIYAPVKHFTGAYIKNRRERFLCALLVHILKQA
jgi:hypothetical protein